MTKLNTEVRENGDTIVEGETYQIVVAEEVTTEARQFAGLRIHLVDVFGEEFVVMLWLRQITGKSSKAGTFITLLGNDTDLWVGKWIRFNQWQDRSRDIQLMDAPEPVIPAPVVPVAPVARSAKAQPKKV